MGQDNLIRTFFVTLRRSQAGKPYFHRKVLDSLGLRRRLACVEKPNNPNIRGMLRKVRLCQLPLSTTARLGCEEPHGAAHLLSLLAALFQSQADGWSHQLTCCCVKCRCHTWLSLRLTRCIITGNWQSMLQLVCDPLSPSSTAHPA